MNLKSDEGRPPSKDGICLFQSSVTRIHPRMRHKCLLCTEDQLWKHYSVEVRWVPLLDNSWGPKEYISTFPLFKVCGAVHTGYTWLRPGLIPGGKEAQLSVSIILPNQVSHTRVTKEAVAGEVYWPIPRFALTPCSSPNIRPQQSPGQFIPTICFSRILLPGCKCYWKKPDTCANWLWDSLSWALCTTRQSFHVS